MAEHWDVFFCRMNGSLAGVCLDLGLRAAAPDPARQELLWVSVPLVRPRPDGLADEGEGPRLHALEEALVTALRQRLGATYTGRVTSASRREFCFYAASEHGFAEVVQEVLAGFPEYPPQRGHERDPEWQHYRNVLYPDPLELQCMHNRHVVDELRKRGDTLAVPRPVDHFLYFPDPAARERFAGAIAGRGFTTGFLEPHATSPAAQRHGLRLRHETAVDLQTINDVVLDLCDAAQRAGGTYDGWETRVKT